MGAVADSDRAEAQPQTKTERQRRAHERAKARMRRTEGGPSNMIMAFIGVAVVIAAIAAYILSI